MLCSHFLIDSFAVYRIMGWVLFASNTSKISFHHFWPPLLLIINYYDSYHYPLIIIFLWLLSRFSPPVWMLAVWPCAEQSFLCIYSVWGLRRFLDVSFDTVIKCRTFFGHYILIYFFSLSFSLSSPSIKLGYPTGLCNSIHVSSIFFSLLLTVNIFFKIISNFIAIMFIRWIFVP